MNIYREIEEYHEPLELLNQLQLNREAGMSASEQGFICGLIKKYKPQKLVEVGVAAGSTSAAILNCIHMLKLPTKMYSVDLSETYYKDTTKPSGYLIEEISAYINTKNHRLMLGKVIATRLEEIGSGIDFLVLDTTHALPGEVLDFLTIFPYLKKEAIVVLHDVACHFGNIYPAYATSVLFHSIVADKFLNNTQHYPNIAAFQINDDTQKYIMDVFASLIMPWYYMPAEKDLADYERVLSNHYPAEHFRLYQQAKHNNDCFVLKTKAPNVPYVELKDLPDIKRFRNVLLYGTKKQGWSCLFYFRKQNIPVKGFVVSDGWKEKEQIYNLPVYEYSKIPYPKEDTLILLTNSAQEPEDILKGSTYHWIKVSGLLWAYS